MSDEVAFPNAVRYLEPPQCPDVHLSIRYAIDARIDSVKAVSVNTTSSCCATGTGGVEQMLKSLRADRALLGEHWAVAGSPPDGPDEPIVSKACGLPQPCSHALALARKYGVKTR